MKYTFLILAVCFCTFSCKKNSKSGDKTEMLTNADWKYNNGGIGDASGNIIIDFSSTGMINDCFLDNTARFHSDGSGTISENANVCTGAPATSNFTWSFGSNETVLSVSSGAIAGIGGSFKIKTLSNTQLSLLKDTTITGVGNATIVLNLKH